MKRAFFRTFVLIIIVGAMATLIGSLLVGCSTTHQPRPEYDGPAPVLTGTIERAAIVIGVLTTPATGYGKNLFCAGADQDAQIWEEMFRDFGITNIVVLRDFQATKGAVCHAAMRLTKNFGPEDLLCVSLSSHGMRVRDYSGDEASGWDTAWCLSGGPWLDDSVWELIQSLPPCRIFFAADTCHAEGSWRQYVPFWDTSHPVDMDVRGTWAGTVVQFAACREAESALGNKVGGQSTCALYDTRKGQPSLQAWFDNAAWHVKNQTPVISKYGPLADRMLQAKPLR